MRELYKGEVRDLVMTLERETAGYYTIATASCRVMRDIGGDAIQEGDCSIDGTKVIFKVDLTMEDYKPKRTYVAYFEVTPTGVDKKIKGTIPFRVLEGGE